MHFFPFSSRLSSCVPSDCFQHGCHLVHAPLCPFAIVCGILQLDFQFRIKSKGSTSGDYILLTYVCIYVCSCFVFVFLHASFSWHFLCHASWGAWRFLPLSLWKMSLYFLNLQRYYEPDVDEISQFFTIAHHYFKLFNLSLSVRLCDTLYISNINDQLQLT